jgi:hypothetical protein
MNTGKTPFAQLMDFLPGAHSTGSLRAITAIAPCGRFPVLHSIR